MVRSTMRQTYLPRHGENCESSNSSQHTQNEYEGFQVGCPNVSPCSQSYGHLPTVQQVEAAMKCQEYYQPVDYQQCNENQYTPTYTTVENSVEFNGTMTPQNVNGQLNTYGYTQPLNYCVNQNLNQNPKYTNRIFIDSNSVPTQYTNSLPNPPYVAQRISQTNLYNGGHIIYPTMGMYLPQPPASHSPYQQYQPHYQTVDPLQGQYNQEHQQQYQVSSFEQHNQYQQELHYPPVRQQNQQCQQQLQGQSSQQYEQRIEGPLPGVCNQQSQEQYQNPATIRYNQQHELQSQCSSFKQKVLLQRASRLAYLQIIASHYGK